MDAEEQPTLINQASFCISWTVLQWTERRGRQCAGSWIAPVLLLLMLVTFPQHSRYFLPLHSRFYDHYIPGFAKRECIGRQCAQHSRLTFPSVHIRVRLGLLTLLGLHGLKIKIIKILVDSPDSKCRFAPSGTKDYSRSCESFHPLFMLVF